MQHWSDIVPVGTWPRGCSLHSACSLVDPNVLSSSHYYHLHQESVDKQHTWLPCLPPDLSVAGEDEVGLDPKLCWLWGQVSGGNSYIDAWILNVATLLWKQVENRATKIHCHSNMCAFLFRFKYHGVLVQYIYLFQQVCTIHHLTKLWC